MSKLVPNLENRLSGKQSSGVPWKRPFPEQREREDLSSRNSCLSDCHPHPLHCCFLPTRSKRKERDGNVRKPCDGTNWKMCVQRTRSEELVLLSQSFCWSVLQKSFHHKNHNSTSVLRTPSASLPFLLCLVLSQLSDFQFPAVAVSSPPLKVI